MANAPLTNIWFPDNEARSRVVAALTTAAAGGGGAAVTITIPNDYPPIDRTIPCPILGMFAAQNGATLVANGQEAFAMANQMNTTLTPDSAGEFRITGARTIEIYQQANEAQVVLVIYVAKGTGQKT